MKVKEFIFATMAFLLALSTNPATGDIPPLSSIAVGEPTVFGNLTQEFYNCAGKSNSSRPGGPESLLSQKQ
jgi:hypothetical protein